MIRLTILIIITLSLIFSSCESRRSKINHKNLIPENELVSILTDIYLTDGLIGMPRIVMKYSPLDSITTYNHVIEKHGYTKEKMDNTMKYYFIKNPKKLIKIYDKVLGILIEMETRVQKDIQKSKPVHDNLWPGHESYSFPDPSGADSAFFDITLTKSGSYKLSAKVTLFPDDQSLNPALTAFTCHPDSLETGKRKYIKPIYYLKDGYEHTYSVTFIVPQKTTLHLRGCLYDYSNNPDNWEKHIVIRNIELIYSTVTI